MKWLTVLSAITVLFTIASRVTATEHHPDGEAKCRCYDLNSLCPEWAEENQCVTNKDYMNKNCCNSCERKDLLDISQNNCNNRNKACEKWADDDECNWNRNYMLRYCCQSCKDRGITAS
ncbi:putative tyrosinase-like protein tyr-3 [Montipora foliosa]|uniref:putative tyrosinase-like protein tyr-3 n=1 Tax=Montipora foliosa TaxID=591990 RepID=UPI0035F210C0